MWKYATFTFAVAYMATVVATDVMRAIVHRRRERRDGLGGTQDIAMWGYLVALGFLGSTIVCAIIWWLSS